MVVGLTPGGNRIVPDYTKYMAAILIPSCDPQHPRHGCDVQRSRDFSWKCVVLVAVTIFSGSFLYLLCFVVLFSFCFLLSVISNHRSCRSSQTSATITHNQLSSSTRSPGPASVNDNIS